MPIRGEVSANALPYDNRPTPLNPIASNPPVAGAVAAAPTSPPVTDEASLVLAANNGRTQAVFRNTHATNTVALGYTAGITFANAPIHVEAGKHWVEGGHRGAIYAICDTGESATLAVQESTAG